MAEAFKHFIDTVAADSQAEASAEEDSTSSEKRAVMLNVLHEKGPQSIDRLRSATGLEFADFAVTLKSFSDAGLVSIEGQPGEERVELTKAGEAVFSLKL
jgi:predicted transcriptional regulator